MPQPQMAPGMQRAPLHASGHHLPFQLPPGFRQMYEQWTKSPQAQALQQQYQKGMGQWAQNIAPQAQQMWSGWSDPQRASFINSGGGTALIGPMGLSNSVIGQYGAQGSGNAGGLMSPAQQAQIQQLLSSMPQDPTAMMGRQQMGQNQLQQLIQMFSGGVPQMGGGMMTR